MTQEFVAESLGVSRQAVSKWESGASDPSTTNLMAFINVNLKMYSFDHLRMYNIDHINTFCGRR